MFDQKGKRKGKGSKIKKFIFYLSHRKAVRDTMKKFGEWLRCLSIQIPNFLVSPDLSGEPPTSRESRPDSKELVRW
jgi:hypothetical protein